MLERIRAAGATAWAVVGIVALLAVVGLVLWQIRVVFPPLILAGAIVFILNPVVTRLQRRHVPRVMGTAASYLAVFALLAGVVALVSPLAARQADDFSEQWPEVRADLERWVDERAADSEDWFIKLPTWKELEDSFDNQDQDLGAQIDRVRELGAQVFHVALIFILAPILAFYLLVDLPHVRRVTEDLVPDAARDEITLVAQRLNRAVGGFFRGQLAVAFIVGTMVSIGLAILDLPFWLIVGMIAGLFNMIPLIGPWVGAVPGVIIALTTRDVGVALWVAAIMAGAQQIDNHFISPLVMQRAVRLHPVAVMMALLAGGTIGGFFGLLLAVPTAAVLKIVLGHVWKVHVLGRSLEDVAEDWQRFEPDGPVAHEREAARLAGDPVDIEVATVAKP